MKKYCILESIGSYVIAEGGPETGRIFKPEKRTEFPNIDNLFDYIRNNVPSDKKTLFSLDSHLEEIDRTKSILSDIRPRAEISILDLRKAYRKEPPEE